MPAQPIMMQQANVLRDGVADYEGRQRLHATITEDGRLTGWMLSAVGLIEMPVGEMPTRGAPTLMPVAPMLMPAGDVLTKQGLYEKTEPPPEICAARQTHHATCMSSVNQGHSAAITARATAASVKHTCHAELPAALE